MSRPVLATGVASAQAERSSAKPSLLGSPLLWASFPVETGGRRAGLGGMVSRYLLPILV
ncbi:MAG: hypothetical protein WA996_21715 [Candidatus Promineifilaceae bacterium]